MSLQRLPYWRRLRRVIRRWSTTPDEDIDRIDVWCDDAPHPGPWKVREGREHAQALLAQDASFPAVQRPLPRAAPVTDRKGMRPGEQHSIAAYWQDEPSLLEQLFAHEKRPTRDPSPRPGDP